MTQTSSVYSAKSPCIFYNPQKSPCILPKCPVFVCRGYFVQEFCIFRKISLYIVYSAIEPVYSIKEPCVCVQRIFVQEPCIFRKRALRMNVQEPYTLVQKELYINCTQALYMQLCVFRKGALYIPQNKTVYEAKEPCICSKRAVYMKQKSPVYEAKEPCI